MELNFNSVEMSSKPNAEASSLDYAEAPLTFNSVETIPVLNASAAFKTDSGKVFKEDVDIVPTIIDKSLSYIPWGGDNSMPYHIIDLIESDETLATCQMFNAEVCYGSGLQYNTDACSGTVKQEVEDFLLDNAMPENEPLRTCANLVTVHETFMWAVPSLDLVLTPNGFGIVSNQNVASASPHRVARLLGSLETSRDIAIEQLIHNLFLNSTWAASPMRRWFNATLFPNIDLANLCGFTDHRWANYLGLRSKAIDVEQRLAEEYVSPEQLAVFRSEVMTMLSDLTVATSHHFRVIEQLRHAVVTVLQGNQVPVQSLRDIVDFMRKNEASFPHFRNSATNKLFEPPVFENKKKNHGYFF